ncbi:beta-ketoacyl-[acyl-carrier-protein] synthase family protein [Streptomyces sp. NPDC028635]|uniref:beta-ketoacyl-[acyl-carrier-protein] synthase family protein n=1 Tax=Streptomyces sp. NPDC028635 TaxID=3154800 RepID=UPI0033D1434D
MSHSHGTPENRLALDPHSVSAAEVIPGDLVDLSADAEGTADAKAAADAGVGADGGARARWYVVVHTVPEAPEWIRLSLRPALGGRERDHLVARDARLTVAGYRVDPAGVGLVESDDVAGARFRDGDRVGVLRVVDPGAVEETYVRRWGVWHRDLDDGSGVAHSDEDVRGWAGDALRDDEVVVRYSPRPSAHASVPRARRVVVTGLGAVTPLGLGVGELWRGLLEGRHGIREVDDPEFAELPVRTAGVVPVDPGEVLPRAVARRMNRAAQFAVLAGREAWGDAGFQEGGTEASHIDPSRVGVCLGAILGDASVLVGGDRKLRDRGPRAVSPLTTPMTVPSQAASQVSLDLHITGEARTVTSACASGTEAIGEAIDRIRYGRIDVALAGGAEAVVTPAIMASFAAMRALSTHEVKDGLSPSRPFAEDRDGFVNGEGAGVLVLEAEEHARARGARIYCEAAGWGLSADAHHMAAPDPSGSGVALALRRALRDAGGHVVDVVHVNAHATATVEGDLAEAAALRGVLGQRGVPVTALKGNLGHLQGAAGGVEAVAAVLTLRDGVVPPTVGSTAIDPSIGLDVVTGAARPLPRQGDLVLSNSFGFGGHNAVLALRRVA